MANEHEEDLVHVRVDPTGSVDLGIGRGMPNLIARLLPFKYRAKRSVDDALTERILGKVRSETDLTERELSFAEDFLSDRARKYMRLDQIEDRAAELVEQSVHSPKLLHPGEPAVQVHESTDATETSEDWVNKFREDASLVEDDLIREIYARVLAEEASLPRAFSLRTLGVLRYLDHEAATAFGRLQKIVCDGTIVPHQPNTVDNIYTRVGLDYSTMLMLDNAGLVNASTNSQRIYERKAHFFQLNGHNRILLVRKEDDSPFKISVQCHLLTPAGMQLARIADCEQDEIAYYEMIGWLRAYIGDAKMYSAQVPSRDWHGELNELEWEALDTEQPGKEEAPTP